MKPVAIVGGALSAGALALTGLVGAELLGLRGGSDSSVRIEACEERDWGETERACEVRELTISAPRGVLSVDAGDNGGVQVHGESRRDVRIAAEVWATSRDGDRAQELLDDIVLVTEGGELSAEGPDTRRRESWGVSWHLVVPTETDLDLEAHNGGIRISDVEGEIRFETLNGGVTVDGLAGDVRGRTTNGGVKVALDGARWQGAGLDIETTNGGVQIEMPEGYSADFETRTVNGRLDSEIAMTVQGRIGRTLSTTLGDGGPPIRAVTTNGSVRIRSH